MNKQQKYKCLTRKDVRSLLKTLADSKDAEPDATIINLFLSTGLRLAELLSLDCGDVNNVRVMRIIGKGGKERLIPLNKDVRAHLMHYIIWKKRNQHDVYDTAPLFISRLGTRYGPRQIQRIIRWWQERAGIKTNMQVSVHGLRHTFATLLMQSKGNKKVSIRVIQELLGHTNLATTTIYTHPSVDDLSEAVESLTETASS